jgi:hypothetical protein
MPVQHFAQPAASTIDTDQPITEIRWDFGYDSVDILESGDLIAQIRNPNILLSSGIDITANNGDRFVIHVKKDVSAGPFAVFRNGTELVGGIPSWGVASSVAGKMVHLPNDLYQEKLAIRKNLERPIRVAQSWLGFSSLVAIVFAYLSGMGANFVPKRFASSVETPLFSGAVGALAFMALALVIQKRTAFLLLPLAQIFTMLQAFFIGTTLLKSPAYPHFGGFRLFVCALTLWVLIDSWNTVRVHRGRVKATRKLNQEGLDEIEKTTVRDLAKVASERGHLLAWQQRSAELHDDSPPDTPSTGGKEINFPSALDLLHDGADPFAPEPNAHQTVGPFSDRTGPISAALRVPSADPLPTGEADRGPAAGENVSKPGWFNRPATISLQPAAKFTAPPSTAPPLTAPPSAAPPSTAQPLTAPLVAPSLASADQALTRLAEPVAANTFQLQTPAPTFPALQTPPQALPTPQHEAWVPPAAPLPEPVVSAKSGPPNHPLRGRVRSGL